VRELRGTGASTGIGIGPALLFRRYAPADGISADAVERETARLAAAVARAREDLAEATKGMTSAVGREEAGVCEAQVLVLDDPELIGRAERLIQDALCPAERAIEDAGADVAAQLESLPDEYLRARAADVRDVAARVRAVLEGATHPLAEIASPSVIVADELLGHVGHAVRAGAAPCGPGRGVSAARPRPWRCVWGLRRGSRTFRDAGPARRPRPPRRARSRRARPTGSVVSTRSAPPDRRAR